MGDPVEDGLVASLARPGGNITGLTFIGPQLVPKRLAQLKETLPAASQVAAVWHPAAYSKRTTNEMMEEAATGGAQTLGVHFKLVAVHSPDELNAAFPAIAGDGSEAVFLLPSPMFFVAEGVLLSLPQGIGYHYLQLARNLCNSADYCLMERTSLT